MLKLMLFGLVGSVVGFEYGNEWPYSMGQILGWIATIVSAFAAICQYRQTKPYQYKFTQATWQKASEGFKLEIPHSKHKRGVKIVVTVFTLEDGVYAEVICQKRVGENGDVVIFSNTAVEGKVVIF